MEFCDVCRNMLYLRTDVAPADAPSPGPRLVKHCKACGFERAHGDGAFLVTKSSYTSDDALHQHVNPHYRFDPTLPCVRDPELRCPGAACPGPKTEATVLYVKYHATDMLYLYCCSHCGHCDRSAAFRGAEKKTL
jgi:DNA-directed RNA polymerase subunit M/transcription elongation factor TFIIS